MLRVLEADTPTGTEWFLTTDLAQAREYLAACGWSETGIHDPAEIVAAQYRGIARLSTG